MLTAPSPTQGSQREKGKLFRLHMDLVSDPEVVLSIYEVEFNHDETDHVLHHGARDTEDTLERTGT